MAASRTSCLRFRIETADVKNVKSAYVTEVSVWVTKPALLPETQARALIIVL